MNSWQKFPNSLFHLILIKAKSSRYIQNKSRCEENKYLEWYVQIGLTKFIKQNILLSDVY